jgi:hypothetical protein
MGRITTDENEKQRILNLHLEATKRHYLKEDDGKLPQSTLSNATIEEGDEVYIVDGKYTIDAADDGVSVAGASDLRGKQFTKNDIIKIPVGKRLYFGNPKRVGLVALGEKDGSIYVHKPKD